MAATFLLDAVAWSRPLTWFTFIRKPIGLSSTSIACLPLNYVTIPAAPQEKCCTLQKREILVVHYIPGYNKQDMSSSTLLSSSWFCPGLTRLLVNVVYEDVSIGGGPVGLVGGCGGWGLGLELDSWNSHSTGGWIPGEGGSSLLTYTFHPQNTLLSQAKKSWKLVN